MEDLLFKAVGELNEDLVMKMVKEKLAKGEDVFQIQHELSKGLQLVGNRYESGDYYIADLIVAGELIKNVMNLEGMAFFKEARDFDVGTIIVGTVFEDIHDVGKDIFISMLQAAGFRTIDLGVDVSSEKFIEAIKKEKPDIIGISGVLTMIGKNMKKIVEDITASGLREGLFIIVGGSTVNNKLFQQLGADAFSQDSVDGVKICIEWMKKKRQAGL